MNSLPKPARRQTLANSRLRKHADYLRAYAAGRKRQSASMSWFLAPQTQDGLAASSPASARIGLTVSKVLGKAHQRNRIKRRMREALRRHVGLLPNGFDLVFHPRSNVLTMEFAQLESEVVRILEQASVRGGAHRLALRGSPKSPGESHTMTRLLLALLAFYKRWLSPVLHTLSPGGCKFLPTCSEYAATAIAMHGPLRGSALAAWRLLRCHPFTRGGFDPVPPPPIRPAAPPRVPSADHRNGTAFPHEPLP